MCIWNYFKCFTTINCSFSWLQHAGNSRIVNDIVYMSLLCHMVHDLIHIKKTYLYIRHACPLISLSTARVCIRSGNRHLLLTIHIKQYTITRKGVGICVGVCNQIILDVIIS